MINRRLGIIIIQMVHVAHVAHVAHVFTEKRPYMIHDFRSIAKKQTLANTGNQLEENPIIDMDSPAGYRHYEDKTRINEEKLNVDHTEKIDTLLRPAFLDVDNAILNYFSNIVVPIDDNNIRSKPMKVRIAGGDRSVLFWQDLAGKSGRIELPVMSINRTAFEFNAMKFSPPYMPISKTFAKTDGSKMRLAYRPYPALVSYSLTVWSDRKETAEYALQQIIIRFQGGLAELKYDTGSMTATLVLKFLNWADSSDIEADASTTAKVRYDITISVEAWIPLPEKILPTVLGKVQALHDLEGKYVEAIGEWPFGSPNFNIGGQ